MLWSKPSGTNNACYSYLTNCWALPLNSKRVKGSLHVFYHWWDFISVALMTTFTSLTNKNAKALLEEAQRCAKWQNDMAIFACSMFRTPPNEQQLWTGVLLRISPHGKLLSLLLTGTVFVAYITSYKGEFHKVIILFIKKSSIFSWNPIVCRLTLLDVNEKYFSR